MHLNRCAGYERIWPANLNHPVACRGKQATTDAMQPPTNPARTMAKQPKQTKYTNPPKPQLKDLKTRKDPKGGAGCSSSSSRPPTV